MHCSVGFWIFCWEFYFLHVCLLSSLIPSKVVTSKELKYLLWINITRGEISVGKTESFEMLKRLVVNFLMCVGFLAKNMEMWCEVSFQPSRISRLMEQSEWPEEKSCEPWLSVWIFHVFESWNFLKLKAALVNTWFWVKTTVHCLRALQ